MDKKFESPYDPGATEDAIYARWEESGYFNPDVCIRKGVAKPDAETFSIVLPPPNVTGTLHMGHAAMLAVEDTIVRYHRLTGKRTLWIPGTDHAAIATQSKVEKELKKKENKSRYDLGRDAFLKRVETFAQESHDTIENQIKKMGSSVDWSREAFTLDEVRSRAVRTAFKNMFNAGLIFRGSRIVNWDPRGQTTISDDEIVYTEEKAAFYYFKYGPFTIGTARPETKFGDKYVVMHPKDERYAQYKDGEKITVEWINGPIEATIIKDTAANPDFGSGVMTITPAHSAVDFEIAERRGLDIEQVIDYNGTLLPIAGEFAGLHISKAREQIVEKLDKKGLLVKVDETYVHNLARAERTDEPIEPQIMQQWFVDVEKEFTLPHSSIDGIPAGAKTTLKLLMRHVVESGAIKILPERFEKNYYHWIDNLRPWCISRQIWYGHRIPVWYRGEEIAVGEPPEADWESAGWTQDEDTLDTWFSSGLWSFSTLGWPEETDDFKTYHPTSLLETGYDILFFWVARMILMTGFNLGSVPFHTVYLHGLVRDEHNRKMSKSIGNSINPLDMIEKYGADATRLSLLIGAAPGNDLPLSEARVKGYKHFANKLWNITRFILMNTEDETLSNEVPYSKEDEALLSEVAELAKTVTQYIEDYRLDLAADTLYQYAWHRLADVILEESKPLLYGDDETLKASRVRCLYAILTETLTLLHPFMPFVTEEIYSALPKKESDLLMVAQWPSH